MTWKSFASENLLVEDVFISFHKYKTNDVIKKIYSLLIGGSPKRVVDESHHIIILFLEIIDNRAKEKPELSWHSCVNQIVLGSGMNIKNW